MMVDQMDPSHWTEFPVKTQMAIYTTEGANVLLQGARFKIYNSGFQVWRDIGISMPTKSHDYMKSQVLKKKFIKTMLNKKI